MASNKDIQIRIKAVDEASPTINKVKAELAGVQKAASGNGAAAAQSGGFLNSLKNTFSGVSGEGSKVTGVLGQVSGALSGIGGASGMAGSALSSLGNAFSFMLNPATALVGTVIGLSTALLKLGQDAASSASKWAETSRMIDAVGGSAESAMPAVKQLIKDIAYLEGKSVGDVRNTFNMLVAATGDVEQAMSALASVEGLMQTGLFRGTRQAVDAVTDAIKGNSDAIEERLPKVRESVQAAEDEAAAQGKVLDASERADVALRALGETYGVLINKGNEYDVQLQRFNQQYDEVKKQIGSGVVPALQDFLSALQGLVGFGADVVNFFKGMGDGIDTFLQKLGLGAKGIADFKNNVSKNLKSVVASLPGGSGVMASKWLFDKLSSSGKKRDEERRKKAQDNVAGRTPKTKKGFSDVESLDAQLRTMQIEYQYQNKRELSAKTELKYWQDALKSAQASKASSKEILAIKERIVAVEARGSSGKTAPKSSASSKQGKSAYQQAMFGLDRKETDAALAGKELSAQQKLNDLAAVRNQLIKSGKATQEEILTLDKQMISLRKQANEEAKRGVQEQQKAKAVEQQRQNELIEAENKGYAAAKSHYDGMSQDLQRAKDENYAATQEYLTKTEEYKKKAAESSAKAYSLERERNALLEQQKYLLATSMLTIEQRVELAKKYGSMIAQANDDQREQNRNAIENLRTSNELFIIMNNLSDTDAEIARYRLNETILSRGLVSDANELAGVLREQKDLVKRIKEDYGLTLEQARGLSDVELERARNIKQIKDEISEARKERAMLLALGETPDAGADAESLKRLYLASGDMSAGRDYMLAKREAEAADKMKQAQDESRQLVEQTASDMKSAVSDALVQGFEQGGKSAVKAFTDYFKNKLIRSTADAMAEGMLKGGGNGGSFFASLFGGASAGPQTGIAGLTPAQILKATQSGNGSLFPGRLENLGINTLANAAQSAGTPSFVSGLQGFSAMAYAGSNSARAGMVSNLSGVAQAVTGGAKGGGFLSKLLGLGGAGGAGGALGMFSKFLPYVGPAMMIASMFKKQAAPAFSGVAALPQFAQANIMSGGLDVLRSSDTFQRAAFSHRNIGGALTSEMASHRLGSDVKVEVSVKPSKMFDAEVANVTSEKIARSSQGGIPNRTGFNNG